MKRILIFCECFYPGYKMGGISQSILNMVKTLSDDFEFYVFTRNHEFRKPEEKLDVISDKWIHFLSNTKVFYSSNNIIKYSFLRKLIKSTQPDFIYLNGIYEIDFVIFPILIAKKLKIQIVQAPRGMLQEGALSLKPTKKKIFLFFFKLIGLHNDIKWQCTDLQEYEDVGKLFKRSNTSLTHVLAIDTPDISLLPFENIEKKRNELKLISISLISPKKNILFVIEVLSSLDINVSYDIYGPILDIKYWETCQYLIKNLPNNIKVRYLGGIPPYQVPDILKSYHIFILPTLGENFGHVIYEALRSARPVIISDKTPWNYINGKKAGWVISISDKKKYIEVLKEIYMMGQEEYNSISKNARHVIEEFIDKSNFKIEYLNLFN